MRFEFKVEFGGKREKKSDIVQFDDTSGAYFFGTGSLSPARVRSYVEAYKISEVVRACVDKINLAAKGIPWYLYQRVGKEIREVEKHPLVDLLRQPSKTCSWPRFLERAIGFYLISGNRYTRKFIGSFRQYGEIEVLASQRITIKTDRLGQPALYEYRDPYQKIIIPLEDMLHSKMFNPADDLYGLSPITTIAPQVDISKFAAEWSVRFLQNDARPAAIAFVPGVLTDDQRQSLKRQWREQYQGAENSGGLLIIETGPNQSRPGDLKLQSYSPRELDLGNSEKTIIRKVCSVYHVPPELLGDAENKTYSNQKEARKALYQEACLPHLDQLRDELNAWLVPAFDDSGDLFLSYDASDIDALSADTNEVWNRAGGAVDRGIITRNEAREVMAYGKSNEPGMDKPTVNANVLPLEVVTAGTPSTGE